VSFGNTNPIRRTTSAKEGEEGVERGEEDNPAVDEHETEEPEAGSV
jgi:hypothetical protein